MARKLSAEHLLELESLYRVQRVLCEFCDQFLPPIDETFSAALSRAYAARDLRGLRMVSGDLLALVRAATPVQRRELDGRLRQQAALSLDDLSARELQRIARIRARGRITSDEQYYLVRERVVFLEGDPERADECDELQRMVLAYEERSAQRRRTSAG